MTRDELHAIIDAECATFATNLTAKLWAQLDVPAPAPSATAFGLDESGLSVFFDAMRDKPPLGPGLQQREVDGCKIILAACTVERFPLSWAAYMLATAYHETAGTMQPIREYGRGQGRAYGVPGPHGGQVAFGRGYVQLTWPQNYERADRELNLGGKLIANYDLALEPLTAARILTKGCDQGWFTGKRLRDYLPAGSADIHQFANCRRVVNGLDKAADIAQYALVFQAGLQPVWRYSA